MITIGRPSPARLRGLPASVVALFFPACSPQIAQGPFLPGGPPSEQAKCKVAASQANPLVTEWAASEKANLETLIRAGGVAVAYSGCSMRVLPQCRLRGAYVWQRTTLATDTLEINDEAELYAKLPLGAASLEAELKRTGKLSVQTMVAGQMRLDGLAPRETPNEGECAQATHLVGALSVGAFQLSTGGAAGGKAGASLAAVGQAGGGVSRAASMLRSAGDPQSCSAGTAEAPAADCRSPIQAFLWPIPGRVAEEGPPGTVKVDFVAASPDGRWDVYIDDQVACTTPCQKWVDPARPVLLRAREDSFLLPPDKIALTTLAPHAAEGAVHLQAFPTARGELLGGVTMMSFGGMALMSGALFTPIGCGSGHFASDSMCTGGIVALGLGAALAAGALWLILDARPRAEIAPAYRADAEPRLFADARVGPGTLE